MKILVSLIALAFVSTTFARIGEKLDDLIPRRERTGSHMISKEEMTNGLTRVLFRNGRGEYTLVTALKGRVVTESFTVRNKSEAQDAVKSIIAAHNDGETREWWLVPFEQSIDNHNGLTNGEITIVIAVLPWEGDSLPALAPKGKLWVCVLKVKEKGKT
jgi:hypothetical protein